MYWNGHFNLDDLCDQFPLDTFDRNNVRQEILLLFKKYLTNSETPDDIFNKIKSTQGSIGVCRIIWPNETVLFKCNDCQYDDTCAICINCFLTSSHNGHTWSMSKSYGGCCDCGDVSSWKPSGSCYKHQGISSRQDGPRSLVSFGSKFYSRSIRLVSDVISFIDSNILNTSSPEHKFSSILLDILKELANLLHGLRWIINNNITCKILSRWIKRHKDLDLSLQKSFGLFYLAMFASPKFKVKFSKIFASNYFSIITPFPKLLYDNTIFNMAELSVQLLTVPEIAISFARMGFINTCLRHMKKLFNTLTISPITHGEFIAKGFLHECTHICTDLSFLLNHKEVSIYVVEDSELHCEIFEMLSSYNYVNSQILHLNQHIEIQNTLYPLTFIIEDGIIFALRPLWLNLNRYRDEISPTLINNIYTNYFKSIVSSIKVANSLQNNNSKDMIYLCRSFHIPLMRLLPNIIHLDTIKVLLDEDESELIIKAMLHVLDQCIKCHLFYLEIKGGIWVRNGDSMLGQNEKYKSMGFLDRDLSCMQMSALIINHFSKSNKSYNFLQVLASNCFPYLERYEYIRDFITIIPNIEFKSAFDSYYYKFIDFSFKCFSIILSRFISNVAQLVASNWDLNAPLTSTDGDNLVAYFLFKMDVIHYIHFESTKIADIVRYSERKWPNGNLFKIIEQIGTIKRYGNGEANVTLKSECLSLLDIYWPGDFNIYNENIITDTVNQGGESFPTSYCKLHNEVISSIYPLMIELLQYLNLPQSRFKLPIIQLRVIARGLSNFNSDSNLSSMIDKTASFEGKHNDGVNFPKRSSQAEALLNLKRKQLSFIANLKEYDDSDVDDEIIYCILCHSSGDMSLLCYQMPISQSCRRPTINNFYPLYKCIETCGHVIHQKCLETYISNKRYSFKKSFPCPLCKLQVNLTIPFIHEYTNLNDCKDGDLIQLNDAFVATYWELLVTTSFKKNLLISNHATMLTQLMKHQYRGSIISINFEDYDLDSGFWSVNPIANLLKFIFTGRPSKDQILNHIRKLTFIVIIQLVLDSHYVNKKNISEIELHDSNQYFRLKRVVKYSLSLSQNCFKCSKIVVNRLKIPRIERYKRLRALRVVDLDLFLPALRNLIQLSRDCGYNIISMVSNLHLYIDRICDFISLGLWSMHCIMPLRQSKNFAHEHLITDQLERFTLLWNLVDSSPFIYDFEVVLNEAIEKIGDVGSRFKPRFKLKMFRLAKNSRIIPRDYMCLLKNTMNIRCILCNSKPSSPLVCLFCCKWLCLYCKDDRLMGSFDHASKCSYGSGCFFLVHQRKVLYTCSFTRRYAYVDSIYSGPFGTFRENLTSNSPLELSRSRLISIANDLFFNRRSIKWQHVRINLLDEEVE